MYLVYAFAFPIKDDKEKGKLFDLYKTIMVFEIISGVLLICQIGSGARRIELQNRQLGKAVKRQGFIFLLSILGASVCYYLMSEGHLIFGQLSLVPCLFAQLAFYFITEMLPLISFIQL